MCNFKSCFTFNFPNPDMFKRILPLLLLLCFFTESNAQTKGIHFVKGSLKAAFELAKKQNKPVFVEIYAIGCPHCENFKKTFDNNQVVGDYFDKRFVSYQVEVNSEEGRAFRKKHNIYVLSTPMMSFWDKDENLLHIQVSGDEQNNEASLKDMADRAIDPAKQFASWKNYFAKGVHDDNFLIEYGYTCRMICDTLQNIAAMNVYAQKQKVSNFNSPSNFVVIQKVIMDDDNLIFKNMMENLDSFYAKYGKKEVITAAENVIMFSLYSGRAKDFSVAKLEEMKNNLKKMGVPEQAVGARFLLAETKAYFKEGNAEKATDLIDRFYKGVKVIDKKDAQFIEKYVRENTRDEKSINKLNWIFKNGK